MTSYLDDPAKFQRVRQEARREGISMGAFIRRATDRELAIFQLPTNGNGRLDDCGDPPIHP